jgi:hypothetical protein
MEIFLMVLCLSLVGVLVNGVLFAAAGREARATSPTAAVTAVAEERFFMMRPAAPAVRLPRAATDLMTLRIEHHVRVEQAAAECFRQFPSVEALHMRTLTPLAG